MIESALKEFLATAGAARIVAALGGSARKFRPFQTRAGTDFPYAEYIVLDDDTERVSEGQADVSSLLLQVDCYSSEDDYPSGIALRDALFQDFTTNFRQVTLGGVYIASCWRTGIAEGEDVPQFGSSRAPYRHSQDFEIGYYLNPTPIV